ncbi:4-amino-4-deoxy-L-arabinose-phosphoundecaprenol flippase subunit ArnE [Pseudomonas pseudonitroreducens]|uniref:4-amino-4-deoxy-L-arabinose-phosphoundecaprenol flippase subunit ArnE n=1 Tax=Pseudomonas pseudonitroreducens TaxID=2892326 RepID=UPI001EFF5691|nr:4-amino-4-deoxy-L-arabinose-phosphoundecaprenol flippase subunit ArnE [Pseudomonas pseudonitroreducens]
MTALLLACVCLLTCMGQLAQKFAVESWRDAPLGIAAKLFSPWLLLAVACLGGSLLLWLLVLQRLDVGVAYPMLSLNFVLVTLLAGRLFGERIDARHWFGVALIVGGVALLGMHS